MACSSSIRRRSATLLLRDTVPRPAMSCVVRVALTWMYHWQRRRPSIANESRLNFASMRSTSSTTRNSITLTTMLRTLVPRLAKLLAHMTHASCNWGLTCDFNQSGPERNLEFSPICFDQETVSGEAARGKPLCIAAPHNKAEFICRDLSESHPAWSREPIG